MTEPQITLSDCPRCHGNGTIPYSPSLDPQDEIDVRCPDCDGTGIHVPQDEDPEEGTA